MKPLSKLPTTELTIPQSDGSQLAILLKDVHHSEEKLGVWCCPAGDFGVHVKETRQKGL